VFTFLTVQFYADGPSDPIRDHQKPEPSNNDMSQHTRIIIECVPPDKQRLAAYGEPLSGDWFFDGEGNLVIRVIGADILSQDDALLVGSHHS
jgi:hypothetical protein